MITMFFVSLLLLLAFHLLWIATAVAIITVGTIINTANTAMQPSILVCKSSPSAGGVVVAESAKAGGEEAGGEGVGVCDVACACSVDCDTGVDVVGSTVHSEVAV